MIIFATIAILASLPLRFVAQNSEHVPFGFQTSLEDAGVEQTDLMEFCAPKHYRLAWCKIDTVDADQWLYTKNFLIVFKDTSVFKGAYVSSDFYQNRHKIKSYYVELDCIDGKTVVLEDEQLKKDLPKLADRLDYLLKKMKIKQTPDFYQGYVDLYD